MAGGEAARPGTFAQSLLKVPLELNVAVHRESSEARTTICISLVAEFHAMAGGEAARPGMFNQSLLKVPLELNVAAHNELSEARTIIWNSLFGFDHAKAGVDTVAPAMFPQPEGLGVNFCMRLFLLSAT